MSNIDTTNAGSAERFRLMVESVQDYGIFMLDPEGVVCSWNAGASRIKQYEAEEVIGRHFSLFYPPEAVATGWPAEELKRAKAMGRYEDEGWRIRKDGTRFWANVVITALVDKSGQLTGFGKVTRDLTERKRHEQALSESEQRFRLLVEGVKDYAIFMLSPDGTIESWNSGATLITGYTAEEAVGEHCSMFYRAEDVQAGLPECELQQALQHGRIEQEGWRLRRDGTAFWANVVLTPIVDGERRLRGYAKVTRDMSERKQLEDLEKSSRRMNEFLAMLAHELRNPLAPIRNAVSILQLEPAPSALVRNGRDIIDRQLSHLTRLVDDLLDVGRLSTGKIRLRLDSVDYTEVVTKCLEAVGPLMDARRHHFVLHMPQQEIHVRGDTTRLTQVLQNLMLNAIKFTPERGQIGLRVWIEDDHLHTVVSDNGMGMDAQTLDEVFDLFSQAEGVSEGQGGLGIGLTLAKSLIEMHGGTLQAASEGMGRGSTFAFVLPTAHASDPLDKAKGRKHTILVCDDNRDAADSLSEILKMLDYQVTTVYGGAAAIAAVQSEVPDAAFLDLGMPDMSGYELIHKLHNMPGSERLLAFAVTGYGNDDDRRRTQAAGFSAHLTKPAQLAQLREVLTNASL
jgi:PAS domain S-box-containing protein